MKYFIENIKVLTSNSGSLSWTGNLSLLTVPFHGRNLVPFSKSPLDQMLNSDAKDGLSLIIPVGVNLPGPKHNSSGQRTKVSILFGNYVCLILNRVIQLDWQIDFSS